MLQLPYTAGIRLVYAQYTFLPIRYTLSIRLVYASQGKKKPRNLRGFRLDLKLVFGVYVTPHLPLQEAGDLTHNNRNSDRSF